MIDRIYDRLTGGILKSASAGAAVAALALAAGLSASSAWADDGETAAGSASDELIVVGRFDVPLEDHTSDVWAHGNFAYLGSFTQPECSFDLTGVRIIDISDPANPTLAGFIKSKAGTRSNDIKVEHIETPFFNGEILVVTDEPCGQFHPRLVSNVGCTATPYGSAPTGIETVPTDMRH